MVSFYLPRSNTPISRITDKSGAALMDGDWYRFLSGLQMVFGPTGLLLPSAGGTGVNNGVFTITIAGNLVIATHGGTLVFPSAGTTMTLPGSSKTLMATDFTGAVAAGGDLSGSYPNPSVHSISPGSITVGGDLSGTLPNPTVAKINGSTLGTTTPTSAHILVADGAQWASVALSGNVTITSAGVATVTRGAHGEITGGGSSVSAVGTMLGLKGSLTPSASGNVQFIIAGQCSHSNAGGSFNHQIRYGTGTAPNAGDALTGTAAGVKFGGESGTAGNKEALTNVAIVTGLTVGTPYWFDISLDNGGAGTATVGNCCMDAVEI